MKRQIQAGFGLLEAVVAMLILSVVVLGVMSVQLRSEQQTQDAWIKSQLSNIMMSQAEMLQVMNDEQQAQYILTLNTLNQIYEQNAWASYRQAVQTADLNCYQQACSPMQFAQFQAIESAKSALMHHARINAVPCPHQQGICLLGAWQQTSAGVGKQGCIAQNGKPNPKADCLVRPI